MQQNENFKGFLNSEISAKSFASIEPPLPQTTLEDPANDTNTENP